MTKFRWHRGGYEESMATCVPANSLEDLIAVLHSKYRDGFVTVKPYGMIDTRNGWDTHVVLVDGEVVGWTDGKPE